LLGRVNRCRVALGVVEPENVGEGVQHRAGRVDVSALFELGVVVDADVGQHRYFLAAQPSHAASPRGRQTDLMWFYGGSSCLQK
jgi:hypothetical protein